MALRKPHISDANWGKKSSDIPGGKTKRSCGLRSPDLLCNEWKENGKG